MSSYIYQLPENLKCRPSMETQRHPAQSREILPKTYFAYDRHLVQFRWPEILISRFSIVNLEATEELSDRTRS